jgi:hypothetical protein
MIVRKRAIAVSVGVVAAFASSQAWAAGYMGIAGDGVVIVFTAILVGLMALMPFLVLFNRDAASFRNLALCSAPIVSFLVLMAVLRWNWVGAAWVGFFSGVGMMWLAGPQRR